jgi:hypothetical protein
MSIALRRGRALGREHRVTRRRRPRAPEEGRLSWPQRALSLATSATVATVLGLLAWIALGMAMAPRAAQPAGRWSVSGLSVQALDPRLIVQPRTVTQVAMRMRPVQEEAREERSGRYTARVVLSMFGGWQLAVSVERRHAAPLVHVFVVHLDLPPALLKAVAEARNHAG